VATLDDNEEWQKRRPYWIRKDIYIPSCEVFKLRFEGIEQTETIVEVVPQGMGGGTTEAKYDIAADIEIIGLLIDESPRGAGGRIPRSG
jgi:hypothetical protein